MSNPEEVSFKIRFKPRQSWVDQTYLGNMLLEVLGAMSSTTGGFDFEVEALKE